MSEQTDPFADIVAGSGMGEWPDDGYETIPPYKLAALQDALIDQVIAVGEIPIEDQDALEVYVATLQRNYTKDFEAADILQCGDEIKLSQSGVVMVSDNEGNYGIELLDSSVYLTGQVARPVIMETPLLESLQFDPDAPDVAANQAVVQLSACIQLSHVKIGVIDHEGGDSYEEPIVDVETHVFVPLSDPNMKTQRKLSSRQSSM